MIFDAWKKDIQVNVNLSEIKDKIIDIYSIYNVQIIDKSGE